MRYTVGISGNRDGGENTMFWILDRRDDEADNCIYATISGTGDQLTWQGSTCPKCGRSQSMRQAQNLSIELYGSALCDFVWTDSADIIVQSELMSLLQDSPLTGFTFRNVAVMAWWRTDPTTQETVDWLARDNAPELYQIVVLGKGGSILPQNKSHIESACATCGTIVYEPLGKGILVDPNQWDGSDVFVMQEFPGYILVTERFLQFLMNHQVQNYVAIPANEFSMAGEK